MLRAIVTAAHKSDISQARFDANRENGKQKDHIYGKILAVAVYLLNKLNRIHLAIRHP